MNVCVTRDSVCAGDDVESHEQLVATPPADTLEGVLAAVLRTYVLPSIQGGHATWGAMSGRPIAVVAQQWAAPRLVSWRPLQLTEGNQRNGVLHLHFTYFAQLDPALVLEVLRRLPCDE